MKVVFRLKRTKMRSLRVRVTFLAVFSFFYITSIAQCPGTANDCDGDGIINAVDLDDDNDGILDATECPITFIDFSSLATPLAPGDSAQTFTKFINGNDLPTSLTIDAPVQLVGIDGNVSISAVNSGRLLRFEDATPAEINHSFTTSLTFGSPVSIRFGANSSIGVSNITYADQFRFEAVGPQSILRG